eukprot:TRINITY_DN5865_c0_g3_i1.p1 TRINITY_DN5865_c0_g3~~TRINITY_DN5865_c0_g3_i1.p1  ORF type:complete len:447 (+),score=124.73 TRINITY_DN5865_c0_g3_i1:86-1426(+)
MWYHITQGLQISSLFPRLLFAGNVVAATNHSCTLTFTHCHVAFADSVHRSYPLQGNMQDTNLAWKIGGVLGLFGLLLLGSLAYNLGSLNQDVHDQRIMAAEKHQREITHKRIQLCKEQLKAINDKNEKRVKENLVTEAETLLREKELMTTVLNDFNDVVDECEATLQVVEAEIADLSKQEEAIRQLELENEQIRQSLSSANSTKEESRKLLRTRVRALRLENEQFRKQKRDKDAQEKIKRELEEKMSRERKALQDKDLGLGEQGTNDANLGRLESLSSRISSYNNVENHAKLLEEKTENEDPDAVLSTRPSGLRRGQFEERESARERRMAEARLRPRESLTELDRDPEAPPPRRRRRVEELEDEDERPRRYEEEEERPRRRDPREDDERPRRYREEEERPRRRRDLYEDEEERPRRRRRRLEINENADEEEGRPIRNRMHSLGDRV